MKTFKPTIIATTALSLLMTSGALVGAAPANVDAAAIDRIITGPAPQRGILLAQAGQTDPIEETEQQRIRRERQEQRAAQQKAKQEQRAAQPAEEAPAAGADEPAEKPVRRAQPAEQPAAQKPVRRAQPAEPAAEEPVRRAQPAEPAAEEPIRRAQPAEPAAEEPVRRAQPAEPAAKPAEPVEQAQPAETNREKRLRERREALRKLQEGGGQATGAGENATQPPQQAEPAQPAEPAEPAAPRQAQPAEPAQPAQPADPAAPRQAQPAEPAQPGATDQAQPNETAREKRLRERREALRKLQEGGGQATGAGENATQPPSQGTQPGVAEGAPENAAPVLDSQKRNGRKPRDGGASVGGEPVAPPIARAPTPPPASDDDARTNAPRAEDLPSATEERGERRDRPRRYERPSGADVLAEIGSRVILELGNQIVVESDDRERFRRGAKDVYYEELPRGRTRETIVRANGVQIVTIRDRYGDVIRRSRITPDGREYVLVYVDENRPGWRDGNWRDPGDELPPLVISMPYEEYILDAERVDYNDDEAYYEFLEQPPVEKVERLYSVDEVKRSARVRDSVRRIDLDTITFETGSAQIAESEVERLDGVANAMLRILKDNPAETFLIEGHTDAVGSDNSNLALSDERAEAVASALSTVFEIPPENLTTQGYGEQYLKIDTQGAERQNRRVAIRRITALVAPVASAE